MNMLLRQGEAKNSLNLYTPVEASANTTHPMTPWSP